MSTKLLFKVGYIYVQNERERSNESYRAKMYYSYRERVYVYVSVCVSECVFVCCDILLQQFNVKLYSNNYQVNWF